MKPPPLNIDLTFRSFDRIFDEPSVFRPVQPRVDAAVAAELEDQVMRLRPRDRPVELTWRIPPAISGEVQRRREDFRSFFGARERELQREVAAHFRHSTRAAVYGLLFLCVCLALHQFLAARLDDAFPTIFDEGLLIIGWVSLWRPAEMFLYDWIEPYSRARAAARLAAAEIREIAS